MKSLLPLAVLSLVLTASAAEAQRATNLQARTAGDLAELCAANPKDPLGDAKINFCQGYAQGALSTEIRHTEGKKLFCFPSSRADTYRDDGTVRRLGSGVAGS